MMEDIDKEIVEAIKGGKNQWVLNTLYKRTLPKIKNLIRKMNGSDEDAQDIFQESVIIFYREVKLNKLLDNTNIDGYIYTVARNLYLNKLRIVNRMVELKESDGNDFAEKPAIERHLEFKDSENDMMQLLTKLGEKCKEILKALAFEELDYQEVADKLGFASGDVVKTQKHRCKKRLEQLLDENPLLYKKLTRTMI